MSSFPLPLLGFAAYSGTGKTTLLKQLIPLLKESGLQLGVIKHAHHQVEVDQPGKDSYELRKAGAGQVLLASSRHWALMVDEAQEREPVLPELLQRLDDSRLDLVLVEGFRHLTFPKIELHRGSLNKPLLFPADSSIIAVASDSSLDRETELPLLDLNDPPEIAEFIQDYCARFRVS
ncbi:MAG: molybdopterin-guanine dinucleotide biosynthesis protein B [gamma proteobacterium symbiont of Ctena orbiculata]|uniref:Molybdopterin-guanine dinucleotide biosynthesis protein B n=1 Tax=Candidatus Thiodiazotropha taylori TaxID=2792791 RepID=A0A944M9S2_9GAMM|nr:molybdopterin-guanine dinucleotide biosynthesis protein B [Candidatus Thiodiazotropha taylori]PUB89172.1 MAG: molybdopterin-guanine dinucleotide biosynthesis protein B [gamma proteobacterium symbiont of Ctena orbiculata]MBT2988809.1 molybdopterin-guanine dinucleotide biosynthesis protein B [Candidatus Thiodiazotropha taylori]MBT2998580.1 molybdopterin-guanine dinucleotide biosynthesis protein B [Candidatus Thiodiazotropha taylori]MBT3001503.1 molybdopterin-guanine dinucleotide biosynthesis p